MELEGLRSLYPMGDLSVMGFAELIPRYFKLRVVLRSLDFTYHFAATIGSDSKGHPGKEAVSGCDDRLEGLFLPRASVDPAG